jgi:ArsR family transcriptional regulator
MPSAPKTRVDLMFRAFSDPIRLRILHLVAEGELCVCDLVEILELPQPTVSRHLSYLRKAGLVSTREERSWNFYRLAPAHGAFHRKLLACLGTCFDDVPELTVDSRRARRLKGRGGCCPPSKILWRVIRICE